MPLKPAELFASLRTSACSSSSMFSLSFGKNGYSLIQHRSPVGENDAVWQFFSSRLLNTPQPRSSHCLFSTCSIASHNSWSAIGALRAAFENQAVSNVRGACGRHVRCVAPSPVFLQPPHRTLPTLGRSRRLNYRGFTHPPTGRTGFGRPRSMPPTRPSWG